MLRKIERVVKNDEKMTTPAAGENPVSPDKF